MSSYSDLALAIINQKEPSGRFSGLNTSLDILDAYKQAQLKYKMDSQLKQQENFATGAAHIYGSAAMTGVPVDPNTIRDYAKTITDGPANAANGVPPDNSASQLQPATGPTVNVGNTPGTTNGITVTASPGNGRNEAVLSKLTPTFASRIKAIADYKQPIGSLRQLNAIGGIVQQYDPSFDANQYKERQSFIQSTWDKGELSKQRLSIENLTQHAVSYQQYQNALANGDLRSANAIKNKFALETGNSNITSAAQFARIVGVEGAKLLSPSGVLSDEAAREVSKSFPENASPAQSTAAIQNMVKAVLPRMNTILERYNERMGRYPDNAFSPEAIAALKILSPEDYNSLAPKLKVKGQQQEVIPTPDNNGGDALQSLKQKYGLQ